MYDDEDFESDVEWLIGNTISREEAESFIKSLLRKGKAGVETHLKEELTTIKERILEMLRKLEV